MADQKLLVKVLKNGEDGLTDADLDEVGRALQDSGIHYELDDGRLTGIPEYWIVDRHPGANRDAVIEFFRLGPSGGYERAGDAVLSELEDKHGTR